MAVVQTHVLIAAMCLLAGCASLPPLEPRTHSYAIEPAEDTRLARAFKSSIDDYPGKTGIYAIPDAREAFVARAVLAAFADRTLDVQYYIWNNDDTGVLLLEALWRAAERGVRVRLLLDDNNTGGMDTMLAAFDAHPNIEVRLYNPLLYRRVRAWNYIASFSRVNRRMHNKSFTADNRLSIVGGRNVGDAYFDNGDGVWLKDLDVIAVGGAVREISDDFDLYWNSEHAYPASTILGKPSQKDSKALLDKFQEVRARDSSRNYLQQLSETVLTRYLKAGQLPLEWVIAKLYADDPEKTSTDNVSKSALLLPTLLESLQPPSQSFDLVSPYFVPGKEGTASLAKLASRGVRVRVLTNSLAATDVAAVHAGYEKRRVTLLQAGVHLYELKPVSANRKQGKQGASSSASLHAKTFSLDGARVFVGSFNFDQRSANLNTEMGLMIESPQLAQRLTTALDTMLPSTAYQVVLDADGRAIEWIDATSDNGERYHKEPNTSIWRRGMVKVLSVLPIEWLL